MPNCNCHSNSPPLHEADHFTPSSSTLGKYIPDRYYFPPRASIAIPLNTVYLLNVLILSAMAVTF